MIAAVVFDLDGVLLDSEQLWDEARRQLAMDMGLAWPDGATAAMLGMSSPEWSAYMHDTVSVPLPAPEIDQQVVGRLLARYEERLPLLPGAVEAVRRMAARWPLALASSSNRGVIDVALEGAGIADLFVASVSSEEVAHGKPAPDVYLEAARRLGVEAVACAVIEDSANGIRSAVAAGMTVVAVPNEHFPPPPEVLARARVVVGSMTEVGPELLA